MDFGEQLREYCELVDCVAKYFLVIGVSALSLQNHLDLGEKLRPELLSQFPPLDLKELPLPEMLVTFCVPWGFELTPELELKRDLSYSVILTNAHGKKVYCMCLQIYEPYDAERVSTQESMMGRSPREFSCPSVNLEGKLVPKVLVAVSANPFFKSLRVLLKQLHALSSVSLEYPIEAFIARLCLKVPVPCKGYMEVFYSIGEQQIKFALPPCNELPLLDVNLGELFSALDLANVLLVFRYLSLENSVVFLSTKPSKLLSCSYTLLSFLYPFAWTLIYVPILPIHMLDYLHSPVNFVYGVHSDYKEAALNMCGPSALVVNLDNNSTQLGNPSVSGINRKLTNIPELPEYHGKKLKKQLKTLLKRAGARRGRPLKTKNVSDSIQNSIREVFYSYYVTVLGQYSSSINFDSPEDSHTFDNSHFLSQCSQQSKQYLKQLLKTQMFANFCEERTRPQSVDQICHNLLFDENIIAEGNRSKLKHNKTPTPFLDDPSQKHRSAYHAPSNQDLFPSTDTYRYTTFPSFNLNLLFTSRILEERPPNYAGYIDVPQASLNITKTRPRTRQECILSSWLEMWAATLTHQQPYEFPQRLGELLNTLQDLPRSREFSKCSLYKLLLQATSKVDPSSALSIFDLMNQNGIVIDARTIQILQKIVSNPTENQHKVTMKSTGHSVEVFNIYFQRASVAPGFKERRFCSVAFDVDQECPGCGKWLVIDDILDGWGTEELSYESECGSCGAEDIHRMKAKTDSGEVEETLFISPHVLKSVVADLLDREKRFNLDVEQLKMTNPIIFWNLIWHFQYSGLPIEFLIPYKSSIPFTVTEDDSP